MALIVAFEHRFLHERCSRHLWTTFILTKMLKNKISGCQTIFKNFYFLFCAKTVHLNQKGEHQNKAPSISKSISVQSYSTWLKNLFFGTNPTTQNSILDINQSVTNFNFCADSQNCTFILIWAYCVLSNFRSLVISWSIFFIFIFDQFI